jgi:hypothetical protein
MVLRSKKNEYRGVNAHLHSYFQTKGGWASFHTAHINDLAREINRLLPPGYLVDVEQSLQREETSVETTDYTAIIIYRMFNDNAFGEVITRIEILTLSSDNPQVFKTVLEKGIRVVTIKYLHPGSSFPIFASYPQHPDAYPYVVIIYNPTPSLQHGSATLYGFRVDEPLPVVTLPLADSDSLSLDMNAIYQITFESLSAYSYRVDYSQPPERFETYSNADQKRIRQVMVRVANKLNGV